MEKVKIGDGIVITVLHTKRGSVRLGIEAPLSTRVVRGELPPEQALSDNEIEAELHGELQQEVDDLMQAGVRFPVVALDSQLELVLAMA